MFISFVMGHSCNQTYNVHTSIYTLLIQLHISLVLQAVIGNCNRSLHSSLDIVLVNVVKQMLQITLEGSAGKNTDIGGGMGNEDELDGFSCTCTVAVLGDNAGSGMDAQAQVTAGPAQVQAPPGLSQSQVQVKGLKSKAEMAVNVAIL